MFMSVMYNRYQKYFEAAKMWLNKSREDTSYLELAAHNSAIAIRCALFELISKYDPRTISTLDPSGKSKEAITIYSLDCYTNVALVGKECLSMLDKYALTCDRWCQDWLSEEAIEYNLEEVVSVFKLASMLHSSISDTDDVSKLKSIVYNCLVDEGVYRKYSVSQIVSELPESYKNNADAEDIKLAVKSVLNILSRENKNGTLPADVIE